MIAALEKQSLALQRCIPVKSLTKNSMNAENQIQKCSLRFNFSRLSWHYNNMPKANRNLTLFETAPTLPDGFVYHENFVSEAEERELIRNIEKLDLTPFKYYQFIGERRTASFGWGYEFAASEIRQAAHIPAFLLPIRARAGKLFYVDPNSLTQTSIVEYSTGSPIGWHRGIPHFGVVLGISLGAACRMRFRRYSRGSSKKLSREEILSIELNRGQFT